MYSEAERVMCSGKELVADPYEETFYILFFISSNSTTISISLHVTRNLFHIVRVFTKQFRADYICRTPVTIRLRFFLSSSTGRTDWGCFRTGCWGEYLDL